MRDEGTSYHYLPPSDYSDSDSDLVELGRQALSAAVDLGCSITWRKDATADVTFTAQMSASVPTSTD